MNRSERIASYLDESKRFSQEEKKEDRTLLLLSFLRLVIFLGGIAVTLYCFTRSNTAGIIGLLLFTLLFRVVLKVFSKHSKLKKYFSNLNKKPD